ncbi:MAG: hypothetical protein HQ554_04110 [FCB group bacterium]|nr:hypothetical protein [FCB group bacterium]
MDGFWSKVIPLQSGISGTADGYSEDVCFTTGKLEYEKSSKLHKIT